MSTFWSKIFKNWQIGYTSIGYIVGYLLVFSSVTGMISTYIKKKKRESLEKKMHAATTCLDYCVCVCRQACMHVYVDKQLNHTMPFNVIPWQCTVQFLSLVSIYLMPIFLWKKLYYNILVCTKMYVKKIFLDKYQVT